MEKLEKCEAGCRIGTKFCGVLAYADVLTLLCPSVRGLQSMLNICEEFGREYGLVFNEKKTLCIKFGNNCRDHGDVFMSGSKLVWKDSVRHLGNMLHSDLTDKADINFKKGCFYHYVNKVIVLFGSLPCHTVDYLFNAYCTSFYGSQTWDLNSRYIVDMYIAWQKSVRHLAFT